MNNLKFKLISILSICIFIIFSCTKEEREIDEINYRDIYYQNLEELKNTLVYSIPGESHNATLDLLYSNLVFENCIDTLTINSSLINEIEENLQIDLSTQRAISDLSEEPKLYSNIDLDDEVKRSYFQNLGVNPMEIDLLFDISHIFSNNNIHSALETVERLEPIVNSSGSEIVQISFDIAKGSIVYWYEKSVNWEIVLCSNIYENDILIEARNDLDKEGLEWLGEATLEIAENDFWSGAVGAAVGAWFGGVGAGPTSIAAACYGSAAGGIRFFIENQCP